MAVHSPPHQKPQCLFLASGSNTHNYYFFIKIYINKFLFEKELFAFNFVVVLIFCQQLKLQACFYGNCLQLSLTRPVSNSFQANRAGSLPHNLKSTEFKKVLSTSRSVESHFHQILFIQSLWGNTHQFILEIHSKVY